MSIGLAQIVGDDVAMENHAAEVSTRLSVRQYVRVGGGGVYAC